LSFALLRVARAHRAPHVEVVDDDDTLWRLVARSLDCALDLQRVERVAAFVFALALVARDRDEVRLQRSSPQFLRGRRE
jgi:hypothetical protein